MKLDLGPLQVKRVIAHEVPRRMTKVSEPLVIYSQVESQLDSGLRNYFREKIVSSLVSAGYEVEFDSDASSPVPNLLTDYIHGKSTNFVEMSQRIADHLYQSQTGVNSSGLLCLVDTVIGELHGIAILKLDMEAAVRIANIFSNGIRTYDLEHVKNLILSQRTKIFKAGIFVQQRNVSNLHQVEGLVSDNQRGYKPLTEVADFFLRRFLGCKLLEAPNVTTKNFFLASEEFISGEVSDPELKAQYETALLAELNSHQGTIAPIDFAERNLQLDDRQKYKDWLNERELPTRQFEKDTDLIKTHLRRISVDFESGVGVLVPPEAINNQVKMSTLEDGRTHLEVRDKITKMRGR